MNPDKVLTFLFNTFITIFVIATYVAYVVLTIWEVLVYIKEQLVKELKRGFKWYAYGFVLGACLTVIYLSVVGV